MTAAISPAEDSCSFDRTTPETVGVVVVAEVEEEGIGPCLACSQIGVSVVSRVVRVQTDDLRRLSVIRTVLPTPVTSIGVRRCCLW